ncbi:Putative calcium-transporting ATPase 13, plasma membrane-type [Ancistrocladus abbreviatus]
MEKVDKICVMARSSPMDKFLMVQCLKQKGHVVAVTGDGTNDAPALKEADIGLSMGIQGTEVAKESSDIVILDDNFPLWQQFYDGEVNVAALVINFIAAVSAGEVPLTAVQLLWVNLIMDTLGALALATEKPTKELMEKPPVGRSEPLITNVMWRNLIAQAVFNEFNARKLEKKNVFEGIHKNKLFLAIISITIVLQVVMVEFLKRFANTERLNWGQWGVCIGLAAASWPIAWLVKCIPVPEKPLFSYLSCK